MAASSAKRTCACAACGCDAILKMKHTFCLTSDACTQNEKLGERRQRGLHIQSLSYISAHACDIWRQQPHLQTMQYLPACQRAISPLSPRSLVRSVGRSFRRHRWHFPPLTSAAAAQTITMNCAAAVSVAGGGRAAGGQKGRQQPGGDDGLALQSRTRR